MERRFCGFCFVPGLQARYEVLGCIDTWGKERLGEASIRIRGGRVTIGDERSSTRTME